MLRDLKDAWGWIEKFQRMFDRIFAGALLENASVTNGMLRFIGGTLRVDSGGRVEIVGTLDIDGTTTVTGEFSIEGPWSISGNGAITGSVTVTGPFTVEGPWSLDGNGDITGDVRVTGDITVDPGGKIHVGNMELNPSNNGGSVKFSGGPEVYAAGGQLALYSTSSGAYVTLDGSAAEVHGPGTRWIRITSSGIQFVGLPTISRATIGNPPVGTVYADTAGNLYRAV